MLFLWKSDIIRDIEFAFIDCVICDLDRQIETHEKVQTKRSTSDGILIFICQLEDGREGI